jgi:anti-anti-sigma regulatory factor
MGNEANLVVVFTGAYDFTCREQLRAELQSLMSEPHVTLDLTSVTYFDSLCIGELIGLHRARAKNGFETETIATGDGFTRQLFDLLKLGQLFVLTDSAPHDGSSRHAFAGDTTLLRPAK